MVKPCRAYPFYAAPYVALLHVAECFASPPLRLHALKGKLDGLHSVSINLKYRITLTMIITEKEIVLVNLGDHNPIKEFML
jgi:mRNA-degrading endonuclease YafQ of YafQ-DinJ toxin-antitoxin module